MCDDASVLEEAGRTDPLGAIDNLGGEGKVAGGDFFTERANGAEGEDRTDADVFEGGNVGAGGYGGRRDGMVFTVASNKGDARPRGKGTNGNRRGWVSPRLIVVGW